ncbi:VOC family protein [Nakamurella endophytica]|uniref:Glyoxalase/bleomycin resistance protein n=1 Tax=Nakamurella endophytica TaxID=1748367 RepID=A0A917WH28_9ACTN|nr:VOC family protein [Nakamurella endophytica]GGM03550.1 putative glyoxalase/bleomycin resistance protein [Nakamurella endophytica]
MLDHIGVQVADVDAAVHWYTQVLAPLGVVEAVRIPTPQGPVVGFAGPAGDPRFWVSPAVGDGPGRENHLAFAAADRAAVDAVRRAADAVDTEVLHEPREWPEYHPGYYAVFLRDPDGNNVEAVCHRG